MPTPQSTRTVAQSVNWAKHFLGRRTFYSLDPVAPYEPALTTANTIIQTMLQPPFKWRWNRASVSFQTINPAGWIANTVYALGYRIQDSNGNMQTVTTAGTSGSSQPTWSTTVGGTTADSGVLVWTMSGITDYVQTIANFGFIEKCTVTNAHGVILQIDTSTDLTTDAGVGRANSIAPSFDNNTGNITFRFVPGIPDQVYTVNVIYQQTPTALTAVTGTGGTWPIPDSYGHIYNNGMLFYFMLYAGDARAFAIGQKFASNLIAISEGLDEQAKAIFLGEWDVILSQAARMQGKMQLAQDGRTR